LISLWTPVKIWSRERDRERDRQRESARASERDR